MSGDQIPVFLNASPAKAAAAMLYMAEELPERWDALYRETALFRLLPVDRLIVALYLADRHSLTTVGAPVYGESWAATWHGLEPQIALAILRNDWRIMRRIPGHTNRTIHMTASADVVKEGKCDRSLLSEIDLRSLDEGMAMMILLDREGIERFHLQQEAWLNGRSTGVVDPRDILAEPRMPAALRHIEENAAYLVF